MKGCRLCGGLSPMAPSSPCYHSHPKTVSDREATCHVLQTWPFLIGLSSTPFSQTHEHSARKSPETAAGQESPGADCEASFINSLTGLCTSCAHRKRRDTCSGSLYLPSFSFFFLPPQKVGWMYFPFKPSIILFLNFIFSSWSSPGCFS